MTTASTSIAPSTPNTWVVWEPLHDDVVLPSRSTYDSAGLDACAYLLDRTITVYGKANTSLQVSGPEVMLWSGYRALIPLGFKATLPPEYEMQVRSRSGLALKSGLIVLNSPGTIDSDYPGEWMVILHNTSTETLVVRHGDRVAQLVLAPVVRMAWKEGVVGQVTDRVGGMGSTGV